MKSGDDSVMIICKKCGSIIAKGDAFCGNCGEAAPKNYRLFMFFLVIFQCVSFYLQFYSYEFKQFEYIFNRIKWYQNWNRTIDWQSIFEHYVNSFVVLTSICFLIIIVELIAAIINKRIFFTIASLGFVIISVVLFIIAMGKKIYNKVDRGTITGGWNSTSTATVHTNELYYKFEFAMRCIGLAISVVIPIVLFIISFRSKKAKIILKKED